MHPSDPHTELQSSSVVESTSCSHLPLWQVALPVHARLQRPQFELSIDVSMQADPHCVVPEGHAGAPFAQTKPGGTLSPHLPQFAASVARTAQASPHRTDGEEQLARHVWVAVTQEGSVPGH
jgi:hypothetical protein